MADVTISSLPLGTPSVNGVIPFSQGGQTYSTALAQLSSLPFIPKAICNYSVNPTATILNSYNIKSFTRLLQGRYKIEFQSPMPSVHYAVLGQGRNTCAGDGYHLLAVQSGNCYGVSMPTPTVDTFYFYTMDFSGNYVDYIFGSFVVFHP